MHKIKQSIADMLAIITNARTNSTHSQPSQFHRPSKLYSSSFYFLPVPTRPQPRPTVYDPSPCTSWSGIQKFKWCYIFGEKLDGWMLRISVDDGSFLSCTPLFSKGRLHNFPTPLFPLAQKPFSCFQHILNRGIKHHSFSTCPFLKKKITWRLSFTLDTSLYFLNKAPE
jgi:hypothetical protein